MIKTITKSRKSKAKTKSAIPMQPVEKQKTVTCLPDITPEIQVESGFNSILNNKVTERGKEYPGKLHDLYIKSINEIMDISASEQKEPEEALTQVYNFIQDKQYTLSNVYMNTVLSQVDGYVRIYKKELGIRLYNYLIENSPSIISEYLKANSERYRYDNNYLTIFNNSYDNKSLVDIYNSYLTALAYENNTNYEIGKYIVLFSTINDLLTNCAKSIWPLEATSISDITDCANLHASIIYSDALKMYTDICIDIQNGISLYNPDIHEYETSNKLDMNEFINMIKLLYLTGEEYINTTISVSLIPELTKVYANILSQIYSLYHPLGMVQEYHEVKTQLVEWCECDDED